MFVGALFNSLSPRAASFSELPLSGRDSRRHELKALVRENQTGRMGTFEQPLLLPQPVESGLALSSVVLSNELQDTVRNLGIRQLQSQQDKDSPLQVGGRSVLPSVTRVFRTNQNLYLLLESYAEKAAPE